MTTRPLFREDAYLREAEAEVVRSGDGQVILEASVFYARGGGQPGDTGALHWAGGQARVIDTIKQSDELIAVVLEDGAALPEAGQLVTQDLDWDRRHKLMRVHTALHLLSVVIPLGVTGGSIGEAKGRLDFDMPEPLEDKDKISADLNALISRDLPVTESWITDDELAANPGLVKTMSVKPPTGAGQVRLVRIGDGDEQVDLQPCGGTHVSTTSEIGEVHLGKVEKKGARNRRVYLHLV